IRENEFSAWYQAERTKGIWWSQRSKLIRNGRPPKQTDALRGAVTALVRDGGWSGKSGIPALRHLLVTSSHDVPSDDTLRRLVDQLHSETGVAGLLRIKRRRRQRPAITTEGESASVPQNPR